MITRERLLAEKRVAKKMDYHPTLQTVHMLIDGALELMDKLDGGQDERDWQAERRNQEAQIRLALVDLDATLAEAESRVSLARLAAVVKARYTVAMISTMLSEKRLAWRREWSWYRPRIEEEFTDDTITDLPG